MAIQDSYDRSIVMDSQTYNLAVRSFKKVKTVYNLPTHATNILTNVTLLYLHDISLTSLSEAGRLFKLQTFPPNTKAMNAAQKTKLDQDLKVISAFIDSGAMLGDYSAAEIKEVLYTSIRDSLHGDDNTFTGLLRNVTALQNAKVQAAKEYAIKAGIRFDEVMTTLYAAEDNVFRLAAFLSQKATLEAENKAKPAADKLTEKQLNDAAGKYAREAFLDYDVDSKAVKLLRQTFLPFISWTYAIIPVLTKIALEQPWKMVNLAIGYGLISAAMSAASGEDDDEETRARLGKDERLFGPFGPYTHVRVPIDINGEKLFVPLGKYIPNPVSFKEQPNGFMGMRNWPSGFTPSGPLVSFAAAAMGVDPYTGKKLYMEADTDMEAFLKSSRYLYQQYTPGGAIGAVIPGTKQTFWPDNGTIGNEKSQALHAMKLFGIPVEAVNEAEATYNQRAELKSLTRAYGEKVAKLRRDLIRGNITEDEFESEVTSIVGRRAAARLKTLGMDDQEEEDEIA
jgi:hypothetical protein